MIKRFGTMLLEEAFEFVQKQNLKTRNKILQNIRRAQQHSDSKFFKKLTDDIWELRTLYSGIQYRLLAFWDKDKKSETLVFATHGFKRKPVKWIEKKLKKQKTLELNILKLRKNEKL